MSDDIDEARKFLVRYVLVTFVFGAAIALLLKVMSCMAGVEVD